MEKSFSALTWSENEDPVQIRSVDQIDAMIDWIIANQLPEFPISITLEVHGCRADILLGMEKSFVYINDLNKNQEAITVGDQEAEGSFDFWFGIQHHTEFERRWLIPISLARSVLREFYLSGKLSDEVDWEYFKY